MSRDKPATVQMRFGGASRFAQQSKAKNTKATLKKLWLYLGDDRRKLKGILVLLVISTIFVLFVPYLVGLAIDALAADAGSVDISMLRNVLLILTSCYLLNALFNSYQGWALASISQQMVRRMRDQLFMKVQKLSICYFDRTPHGELMSRLTNDVDNVSQTVSQSLATLISGVLILIGTLTMMLILSPVLTLATLVVVPLVYGLTRFVSKTTRVLFKEQQKALGFINGMIEESISGVEVVRAFNQEEAILEKFADANQKLRDIGVRALIYSGFLMPLMNVIANFGFAVVATFGGVLATHGYITVGVIASFLTFSRQFSRPLNDIANLYNTLQSALAGAERVFEIMEEIEEQADITNAIVAPPFLGEVVFDSVDFSYEPETPILKNISFVAEPGQTVALVGPTGAGKTTITSLLTRFYEVNQGEIRIDGINIASYSRESLRKNFGVVLQDTYLFLGTIKENLRYGKLDATDDEIIEAAKLATSHEFIVSLPEGYQTILVEGGNNLSLGQRQLLAITRSVLADPSILILDEATSSIDTRTELKIQQALHQLMKGRTSFVVAHRLSTILEADLILVIDHGEIIEKGTHDDLVQAGGFYASLYSSQIIQD